MNHHKEEKEFVNYKSGQFAAINKSQPSPISVATNAPETNKVATPTILQESNKPNIPQRLPQRSGKNTQNVSMLNNNTNFINGGSTYLVSEEKVSTNSVLYDLQYNG